ncbi:MAG: hypothetical protein M3203_12775, partial [Actinomycetota bacterium]|nr:hypothetical protein [Actinomycetota bacterium]
MSDVTEGLARRDGWQHRAAMAGMTTLPRGATPLREPRIYQGRDGVRARGSSRGPARAWPRAQR